MPREANTDPPLMIEVAVGLLRILIKTSVPADDDDSKEL